MHGIEHTLPPHKLALSHRGGKWPCEKSSGFTPDGPDDEPSTSLTDERLPA
jgi:hypothetical protein